MHVAGPLDHYLDMEEQEVVRQNRPIPLRQKAVNTPDTA